MRVHSLLVTVFALLAISCTSNEDRESKTTAVSDSIAVTANADGTYNVVCRDASGRSFLESNVPAEKVDSGKICMPPLRKVNLDCKDQDGQLRAFTLDVQLPSYKINSQSTGVLSIENASLRDAVSASARRCKELDDKFYKQMEAAILGDKKMVSGKLQSEVNLSKTIERYPYRAAECSSKLNLEIAEGNLAINISIYGEYVEYSERPIVRANGTVEAEGKKYDTKALACKAVLKL
jgi:hypothetical protein